MQVRRWLITTLMAGLALCAPAAAQDATPDGSPPTPDYGPVTVRCNAAEMDTLVTIMFAQAEVQQSLNTPVEYPLNIYGIDGLLPAVRVDTGTLDGSPAPDVQTTSVCIENANAVIGDVVTLPDATTFTVTDETLPNVAQLSVRTDGNYGVISTTFGARGGTGGRYLAFVAGLTLDPADDVDQFRVRIGPRAALASPLDVYVIGVGENSRLDPVLRAVSATGDIIQECDDAGRRACADMPPAVGVGVALNYGVTLLGDRFDAGLRLAPGWVTLEVSSLRGNTRGDYALLFSGEIAPR